MSLPLKDCQRTDSPNCPYWRDCLSFAQAILLHNSLFTAAIHSSPPPHLPPPQPQTHTNTPTQDAPSDCLRSWVRTLLSFFLMTPSLSTLLSSPSSITSMTFKPWLESQQELTRTTAGIDFKPTGLNVEASSVNRKTTGSILEDLFGREQEANPERQGSL